jgi:predicted patatin/cPLA2 family phospholipase
LISTRRDRREASDGRRLALVVEGGAMLGVYTAGSLLALHLIDSRDAFDDLYGTSAGACNGAHFLSGVGHTKVGTYYRWLHDRKFINRWRLRKMVDIDYFADDVLARLEKVEVELVNQARTELWVAALNARTKQVEIRNPRREVIPLLLMLKAAVALPAGYGKTIAIGDKDYLDSGFVQPFPLRAALEAGCTDLLVLTARPAAYRSTPPRWWQRELFDRLCVRGEDGLRSLYRIGWERQNEERRLAEGVDRFDGDANIATLAPDTIRIKPTTTEPILLRAELIRMCRLVLNIFDTPHSGLDQLIATGVV